jgi:tetratricopeptide (TPR) repeat protein
MTSDPTGLGPTEVEVINAQASILIKRGIGLMMESLAGAVEEALECFDRALALRLRLPIDTNPMLRYGLAACWLNRADALVRTGDAEKLPAAVQSYDEGIVVLRGLTLSADPRFPKRLAMAHQNRALALHTQGRGFSADCIAALGEAIAVLESDDAAAIPERAFLLAAAWTNLANVRAMEGTAEGAAAAREAALRAIPLVASLEEQHADAADVGLRARHVLCRTIAARLAPPAAKDQPMPEEVYEATDLADEGLGLVRAWEKKGVTRFRGVALDLFRFGARVYGIYQPHFLKEFVLENIDPEQSSAAYVESPEMRAGLAEIVKATTPAK